MLLGIYLGLFLSAVSSYCSYLEETKTTLLQNAEAKGAFGWRPNHAVAHRNVRAAVFALFWISPALRHAAVSQPHASSFLRQSSPNLWRPNRALEF